MNMEEARRERLGRRNSLYDCYGYSERNCEDDGWRCINLALEWVSVCAYNNAKNISNMDISQV